MSHNRISIVGLVLLALTASAFVATKFNTGLASQTDKPLKMKVIREKAHVKKLPGPMEIAAFKRSLPQEDERKLEDLIPKHVPIKIKIKKEKEARFKDAKNERWAREFELEVTNTGTKPIYYLYFTVVTDIKAAAGFRIVFPLTYGRSELGDIRTKAEPTDIPIQPNESVSLKIHPSQLDAWDFVRRKENRPFPKHLQVKLQVFSFGDGTGYFGSGGDPIPRQVPDLGNSKSCRSPVPDQFAWKDSPPDSRLSKLIAFNLPAPFEPVNFWAVVDSKPTPTQTCCNEGGCSPLISWTGNVCVNCPQQNRPALTTCGDPAGSCQKTTFDYIECFTSKSGGESYACQTVDLSPCGSTSTPSPSPSPTPSPTPSPSPTPTPCPIALPSQCPGGVPRDPCTNPDPPPLPGEAPPSNPEGCPFGFEASGVCCVPIACPQPTPTPPSCPEGEASTFTGPPICQWSDCFTPFPLPGASPTPAEYIQECIDYYWVWFVSYDGGRTWQPTGHVEYAGCFFMH